MKDWSEYYVVVTTLDYYKEICIELQSYGLTELKDFIIYRKLLNETQRVKKPSEMMRQTMYDRAINIPICARPFEYTEILFGGNIYPCCPAWVHTAYGSMNTDNCHDIWQSNVAKIFRLSIINRTFSFCNKNECAFFKKHPTKNDSLVANNDEYKLKSERPKFCLISIDPRCNLKCPSCRDKFLEISEVEKKLIELHLFRLQESAWLDVANIGLTGYGETFFNPTCKKLMFETDKRRSAISIISNGILFDEKNLEKLLEIYDKINVSISVDAATEEVYKEIRGGNFSLLLSNLKNLAAHRKNNEINDLTLNFVAQKKNLHQIPKFIELAHELGVDRVRFQKFHAVDYMDETIRENFTIADDNDRPIAELQKVLNSVDVNDPIADWYQLTNYLSRDC